MNVIIGDIGNTITKISLVQLKNFKIKKIIYFNSQKIYSNNNLKLIFKKIIKKNKIYKIALFSSVVPKHELKIKSFLKKKYHIILKEIKDQKIKKIVKINIKNKNQVGSDRIANAVGVYKKYKTDSIVLDFGTATTFDVVSKYGLYNGGVIAPGINLSIKSLSSSADQIPLFALKKQKKTIGKNTIEALRSGFYWGYLGLINNIILMIEKETKKSFKIIITGGFSSLFVKALKLKVTIDRDITIKGLIRTAKIFNF